MLNQMQDEINAQETSLPIRILGVNEIGAESGNSEMTAGRVLPWLEQGVSEDVWTLWQVTFRDVVILGRENERLDAFNLTENNLSDAENYAALKNLLLAAAGE